MRGYSIETYRRRGQPTLNHVPAGTTVNVTYLPGADTADTLTVCRRLADEGMTPVPHVAARNIASADQLDSYLGALAGDAGVREALVIAGPRLAGCCSTPAWRCWNRPIRKTRRGRRRRPSRSLDIDAGLAAALPPKRLGGDPRCGNVFETHRFEAAPVLTWEEIRAAGNRLPIKIGSPTQRLVALVKYAQMSGVSSLRLLTRQTRHITKLLTVQAPDRLVAGLAAAITGARRLPAGFHLDPLAASRTAAWANAVVDGAFDLMPARGQRAAARRFRRRTGGAAHNLSERCPMTTTILHSASREVRIGFDHPFCVIGERINPTGRKLLAAEMAAGDFGRVEEEARAQVAAGAHMLDVNAGIPLTDEAALLAQCVVRVQAVTDVPLAIDSSVVSALAAGLAAYQGKALVNSVTGEEERLETILPLVKKHGAAVVAISNDESGISEDPDVRFDVARRIVAHAADYGIAAADVIVDPLVMPVGALDHAGVGVLRLIRRLHAELGVNTICGASNISFGLPARDHLNATFLAMAIGAGMTSAIMNPLRETEMTAVHGANVMAGHDPQCRRWIARFRAPVADAAGEGDQRRARRRAG